jgi:hypothetical protein
MFKKLFALSLFILGPLLSNAQWGLNGIYIKPSSKFGVVFKPTFSGELVHLVNDFGERVNWRISIGYISLKPTQDTFYTWGILYNGQSSFTTGTEIWRKYDIITCNIGLDYKIIDRALSPIIGLDAGLNFNSLDYSTRSVVKSEEARIGTTAVSCTPKIGVSYELNDAWLFILTTGKSLNMDENYSTTSFWKTQVGAAYFFD